VDLQLYFRVLWRFRLLVGAGVAVAILLALLSMVRISPTGSPIVSYRQNERWEAQSVLFITQAGFPWGRAAQRYIEGDAQKGLPPVPVADYQRLSGFSVLYAELANSDGVKAIMRRDGPVPGKIEARPYIPQDVPYGTLLPMVAIVADAKTPKLAIALAERRSKAFLEFIHREQDYAAIAPEDRLEVQELSKAQKAKLIVPRKKTLPIVVFVAVMTAVVGLAFFLENIRPRVRPLELEEPAAPEAPRRTA
jgi:hypothetical protein